jgi:hypothetical protein
MNPMFSPTNRTSCQLTPLDAATVTAILFVDLCNFRVYTQFEWLSLDRVAQ